MNEKKSKVRVLFATASTTGGGAERMLFNIIHSLDNDHDARLFITSSETVPATYAEEVVSINANKQHAVSAFWQLIREIKDFKPHHVFTTSSNVGYLLVLAKKLLRADFKVYIRCAVTPSEIYHTDLKSRLLHRLICLTYNSSDMIIAQTEFMRDDLIRSYKINPDKVTTIRNIIDKDFVLGQSELFEPAELNSSNINIIGVGALYSVKGFDLLIDALVPVIQHNRNIHLFILGEERYESGYRVFLDNKINENGMEENIHLLGQKSNPYPYFKAADLFVMSSRKEGFPNVVLEALMLGAPVVASDCVDFTGIIYEGINGYIVKKNSSDSLREGIEKALETSFDLSKSKIDNYDYNQLFR